ncbi:MAG: Holliday junction branch migration protein RuvA [Bacteroidota bacterium]
MYEFILGKIAERTPAYMVLEVNGIGYFINISLHTFSRVGDKNEIRLFIHEVVREDAHLLFGFADKRERDIFRLLISVSGVGSNTARLILSSLSPDEIEQAILSGNVNLLKSVKGIGLKSAQRLIVDLKDKIGKSKEGEEILIHQDNTIKEEALSALVTLGFAKGLVEKTLTKILAREGSKDMSVEDMVKVALKQL